MGASLPLLRARSKCLRAESLLLGTFCNGSGTQDVQTAESAIRNLHDTEIHGRMLRIAPAESHTGDGGGDKRFGGGDRDGRGGGGGGGGQRGPQSTHEMNQMINQVCLFCGSLAPLPSPAALNNVLASALGNRTELFPCPRAREWLVARVCRYSLPMARNHSVRMKQNN